MRVFTIGHSNHDVAHFLALLQRHGIQVLADVRSWPHSKHAPWTDAAALPRTLKRVGCRYVPLGDALGGRPADERAYLPDGRVRYGYVAASRSFAQGLERLRRGIEAYTVVMMCSEEDPEHCHRRLLVAKVLTEQGVVVDHIRGDGRLERERGVEAPAGMLFAEEDDWWTSTRSVSRRRRPAISSVG